MSMPKGFKAANGYATVGDEFGGMDYRTIAEKMTENGHKMNHATARNVFLRAMKKLAASVCDMYENPLELPVMEKTVRDPLFQNSMIELITEIYDKPSGGIDV